MGCTALTAVLTTAVTIPDLVSDFFWGGLMGTTRILRTGTRPLHTDTRLPRTGLTALRSTRVAAIRIGRA